MKIDLHHHILPKEYLKALKSIGVTKSFGIPFPKWNIQNSLDMMEHNSIIHSVLSISAPGVYFNDIKFTAQLSRQLNEIIANTIAQHSSKFSGFCILPLPNVELALKELEYAFDVLGLNGVTLVSNVDNTYLGDRKWKPLYRELNKRKARVLIHPNIPVGYKLTGISFPPGIYEVTHDTTRAVANLLFTGTLNKYPDIIYILSHAGGAIPYLSFRLSLPEYYLKGKILLKIVAPKGVQYYLKQFYYDIAMAVSAPVFSCLKQFTNTSHITFGTDFPYINKPVINKTISEIDKTLFFNEEEKELINLKNALHLFPDISKKIGVKLKYDSNDC